MKDKFKKAVDKILKNGTTTQWIFTGKEDEDNKTLAEDIANACNTLHNQAMKEAVKKALLEGAKLGIEAVAGTIKEINKQL